MHEVDSSAGDATLAGILYSRESVRELTARKAIGMFACQRRLQRAFQICKAVNNLGSPKVPQRHAMSIYRRCHGIHSLPFSSIVAPFVATIIQHEVMRRVFQESLGICKQRKQQRYAINGVEKPNTNAKYINRSKSTLRWPTRKLTRRSSRSAFSFQIPSTSTSSHTSPVRQLDSTCPSLALGCRSC